MAEVQPTPSDAPTSAVVAVETQVSVAVATADGPSTATAAAASSSAASVDALMDAARDAAKTGDVERSKAVHDAKHQAISKAEENHGGAGSDYVKSIVFGALDGVITEFAVVASVAGADLAIEVILITGVAKLLGDALSMAIGDAMSEQAEHAYIRGELKREEWEFKEHPQGEIDEMVEIYTKEHGFTEEDARTIITTMTKKPEYKDYFISHMMVQELGEVPPEAGDNPLKNGLVTFVSFIVFGFIPLLAYIVFYGAGYHNAGGQLGICAAMVLVTLFALGALQAKLIRQSIIKQGTLMMINGGVAAAAAYLIGWGMQKALNVEESEC